ncbi:MAG: DUF2851 family protein [Saprospiraceae bacterium]|nr:DUF2851 family protein [Saprospiraceae bacterium]
MSTTTVLKFLKENEPTMPLISPISEDFLHYIWKTKKLNVESLITTAGSTLQIIDFGVHNSDSGPDFFNGKVRVDDTVWAGNIEMHVRSSDWNRHNHQADRSYHNVILHVVYEHDTDIVLDDGRELPCLELKGRIPKIFLDKYLQLSQSLDRIPCERNISMVDKDKISLWKYGLILDRFERKTKLIQELLNESQNDWEQTLYVMIARYFGSKVNVEPFERLARITPFHIILKNRDKAESLDALLFGQAGMLIADYKDNYFKNLQKEYDFLKEKYSLKPIDPVTWKFSRLRPPNFPTVRIAQLSAVLHKSDGIFSRIKSFYSIAEIRAIFEINPNSYWNNHYKFDTISPSVDKHLSDAFIDLILINAVAPVLFHYGKSIGEEQYTEKAISLLESLPAEQNNITRLWSELGLKSKTAFDAQSLIHLKTSFCDLKRCLNCKIGHEILGK